jgi:hypothetical protein
MPGAARGDDVGGARDGGDDGVPRRGDVRGADPGGDGGDRADRGPPVLRAVHEPGSSPRSGTPWFVWASLVSVTCIVVGLYSDISWHLTVGRDTFWTPAHVLIQLGGIIGGASGCVLIFSTTLDRRSALRDRSIGVWGFRGPFGAFLAAWGAATMVVSAPFDNWWHSAYGLDVTILSPPHTVLVLGILGVAVGGVLNVVATLNRATGALRARLAWILLVIGAEILVLVMTAIFEYTFRANLHSGRSYRAVAIVAPLALVGLAQVSGRRWAATAVAAGYTVFMAVMLWVLALIPAEPKLGPVYQVITHFVPPNFPVLVVVPALALDLVRGRIAGWRRWRQAIVLGGVFVASLVAVEWPFASFLQSDASHTWVFGTHYHPYFMSPESLEARGEFIHPPVAALWLGMAEAVVAAITTSWIGLAIGDALRKVRR